MMDGYKPENENHIEHHIYIIRQEAIIQLHAGWMELVMTPLPVAVSTPDMTEHTHKFVVVICMAARSRPGAWVVAVRIRAQASSCLLALAASARDGLDFAANIRKKKQGVISIKHAASKLRVY